ncbi:hypothetical protein ASC97_23390 [Rhizobium sp. Root1203]|uniref:ABC transporter ATP-binding protein n=1 Tax=Rhizobium sp. Root1203 TaxID=1736427 RepID=UPI00070ADCFC|nr:sn-glycerol-3-phosphate ABC transporter ATP-binding protein UgpC [Rhizobium sp. Root1203]KQV29287.1 hypothetical protein ASC97_23390 [Rhizobium sp. Root1203]
MARVQLRDIGKSYGEVSVIEGLNLDIEDGAFTVFVGPSGCGKSTLLRMIAGLEAISSGDMEIDGRRVNDADPIERGVAMVFQNYALYPHMTVEQNISFSLRMARLPKAEIGRRVAAAATTLQIGPLLKRRPSQLSGGQRQRVAIGRAIVRDPEVFLFDEPLSNLDAELRVTMRVEIAKLHRQIRSTMIYVTHDQTEAMTLADKIVVLREGKVEQMGSPEQLYENPANMFVAGFIGSPRMNFVPGRIAGGTLRLAGGETWPVGAPEGEVMVGLRPEHFVPADASPTRIMLNVDVVENLGGTRYLYGTTAGGENLVVEAREQTGVKPGDRLEVGLPLKRVHLFTPGGKRLA